MDDLFFLCLTFGLFFGAVILFMLVSRFLGGQTRGRYYPPAGTYDDPAIRSGGSIGGIGRREYDASDISSGGSFGGSGSRAAGPGTAPPARGRREYDDPDVRSGGSFGG